MLVKTFTQIHGSGNLSEEGKSRRERTKRRNIDALVRSGGMEDQPINFPFNRDEVKIAICNANKKCSSPGKDQVAYIMTRHLKERAVGKMLELYNRVWEEGKLPKGWKEAIIIPIRKPGKDSSKPSNNKPIALTSNICKNYGRDYYGKVGIYIGKKRINVKISKWF